MSRWIKHLCFAQSKIEIEMDRSGGRCDQESLFFAFLVQSNAQVSVSVPKCTDLAPDCIHDY